MKPTMLSIDLALLRLSNCRRCEGEPGWNLRMCLVNHRRVHNTIGARVGKGMKQRGIDDAEDGRRRAYAESKRKNRNQ